MMTSPGINHKVGQGMSITNPKKWPHTERYCLLNCSSKKKLTNKIMEEQCGLGETKISEEEIFYLLKNV